MDKFELQGSIKSKDRVKDHGEVYTPQHIVNDMLNLDGIKEESYRIDSKFLEPACGNGNFLVEILRRKLEAAKKESTTQEEFDINVIKTVCSIYAVDILRDNIKEAKGRMTSIIEDYYDQFNGVMSNDIKKSIKYILDRNIILGDTLESTMVQPVSGQLIYNEWVFEGNKIKRSSFKATCIEEKMNCNYRTVLYNKLYTLKDEEEEDIEL